MMFGLMMTAFGLKLSRENTLNIDKVDVYWSLDL